MFNIGVIITDPKVTREQVIRDAKVTLILDAARTVFSEKGFFDTRLEDIAVAAGFSKAALYTYYTDKEEIFLTLAIRELEGLSKQLNSKINLNIPIMENLEISIKTVLSFFGENYGLFVWLANFMLVCRVHKDKMSETHQKLLPELQECFKKILELYVSILHQARVRKEFYCQLDDFLLATYIGALSREIFFQWQLNNKMGDVASETKQLITFLTHGLDLQSNPERIKEIKEHHEYGTKSIGCIGQ